MIYTELTMRAMKLCYQAHAGQTDKGGLPYVFHPFHVAEQMDDEISTTVALLHDIVEDTPMTLDELRAEGYPPEVVEAINALSRRESERYMDYVDRLKKNPLAKKVKLADLAHNSDQTRIPNPTEKVRNMWKRYERAKERLLEE